MKRAALFAVLAVLLAIALVSCAVLSVEEKSLIGTWVRSGGEYADYEKIVFKASGKVDLYSEGGDSDPLLEDYSFDVDTERVALEDGDPDTNYLSIVNRSGGTSNGYFYKFMGEQLFMLHDYRPSGKTSETAFIVLDRQ